MGIQQSAGFQWEYQGEIKYSNSVNNQDTGEDNSNVLNQKMGHKSESDFASRDLYAGVIDWKLSKTFVVSKSRHYTLLYSKIENTTYFCSLKQ